VQPSTPPRAVPVDIAKRLKKLPMLPTVFGELIGLDPEAGDYAERVRDIARREPTLAAKLLSVANAALLGSASPITTLDNALVRMGARRVAGLIASFVAVRIFAPTTQGQRDLWRHALQTAAAASEIAAAVPWQIDAQRAYVAGLLHDIGRFVTFEDVPEDADAGLLPEWTREPSILDLERAACGSDHCEVGMLAAREWALPRELWAVVRVHHQHADLDGLVPAHIARLVRVVQQADAVSEFLLRPDVDLAELDAESLESKLGWWCICPTWSETPLDAAGLARLLPRIAAQAAEQIAALSLS
jgi:putative nucleotidyltransferase with HDIG domain